MQLLTKVLNHVVPLGFPVHQKIKANLLLETNNGLNLLLDELFVLLFCKLAFAELGASLTDLFSLLWVTSVTRL